MSTAIFDLDQQHYETQGAIAESLYIDGESDGFDGIKPRILDWDYTAGYLSGVRRYSAYVQSQAQLLQQEATAVEAMLDEF